MSPVVALVSPRHAGQAGLACRRAKTDGNRPKLCLGYRTSIQDADGVFFFALVMAVPQEWA